MVSMKKIPALQGQACRRKAGSSAAATAAGDKEDGLTSRAKQLVAGSMLRASRSVDFWLPSTGLRRNDSEAGERLTTQKQVLLLTWQDPQPRAGVRAGVAETCHQQKGQNFLFPRSPPVSKPSVGQSCHPSISLSLSISADHTGPQGTRMNTHTSAHRQARTRTQMCLHAPTPPTQLRLASCCSCAGWWLRTHRSPYDANCALGADTPWGQ